MREKEKGNQLRREKNMRRQRCATATERIPG
jgi:hypothetical protein